MTNVNGKVTVGAVSIECNCDTSQLDEALEKTKELMAKLERCQLLSSNLPIPVGMLATSVVISGCMIASSPRKISRRSLFNFWRK